VKAVLDAGAFVAIDNGDRRIGAMLRVLQQRRVPLTTSSTVVAQVWRDGRKQARLAQILAGVASRPLGAEDERRTGELLALARTHDVVDGHLALGVDDEDMVLTSDPEDIERLLAARRIDALLLLV
jgi:hypothetical protein